MFWSASCCICGGGCPQPLVAATEPRDQTARRRPGAKAKTITRASATRARSIVTMAATMLTTMATAAAAVTGTRDAAARRRDGATVACRSGLGCDRRSFRQRPTTEVPGTCAPPPHNVATATVLGREAGAATTRDQFSFNSGFLVISIVLFSRKRRPWWSRKHTTTGRQDQQRPRWVHQRQQSSIQERTHPPPFPHRSLRHQSVAIEPILSSIFPLSR